MTETAEVALITGASRGLGAAAALLLARNGYAVCVNYNQSSEQAEAVAKSIRDEGGKAIAIQADVSDPNQIKKLFTEVDSKLGPLTALINNAGFTGSRCKVLNLDIETIKKLLI